MIKDGKGGSNTKVGKEFEKEQDILEKIKKLPKKDGYMIKENDIWHNNQLIARVLKSHKLYKEFLTPNGIKWEEEISKKLLPDTCVILENENRIIIIEIKYQSVKGSVDEKLQTCDFKKKEYEKLFKKLNKKVDLIYCLSNYFKDKHYKDVREYIKKCGCNYYFEDEEIPLELLGLK